MQEYIWSSDFRFLIKKEEFCLKKLRLTDIELQTIGVLLPIELL